MINPFTSIASFKTCAEFFPAGKIIPRRILRAPKEYSSATVFAFDSWALPTPSGYIVLLAGDVAIRLKRRPKTGDYRGSPYGGETRWIATCKDEDETVDLLHKCAQLEVQEGAP